MKILASKHLSETVLKEVDLLDVAGVDQLFAMRKNPVTNIATQVQLDEVVNQMLSVQVMYKHFIKNNFHPKLGTWRISWVGRLVKVPYYFFSEAMN